MIISAIVAIDKNNVIGKDNQIPWYLPADLQYFKKITLNHHILMGRNCFLSIGKPLPKRTNIVITRNPFFLATGVVIKHNIQEAIAFAKENNETELFIIGGGEIYNQTISLIHKLYITEVELETDGEINFPKLDANTWSLISEEKHLKDDKNEYNYTFKTYLKK
jgi:dihydrofolate reductase